MDRDQQSLGAEATSRAYSFTSKCPRRRMSLTAWDNDPTVYANDDYRTQRWIKDENDFIVSLGI